MLHWLFTTSCMGMSSSKRTTAMQTIAPALPAREGGVRVLGGVRVPRQPWLPVCWEDIPCSKQPVQLSTRSSRTPGAQQPPMQGTC